MKKKIVCPDCETAQYYYRQADDSYVCRKCGTAFPANKQAQYEAGHTQRPNEARKVSE